ncbi:MAG: DUF3899 domain-containing protein [Lachnospiraceae bacterium]|nr:DUF3899 domain-containing protein [Lachnospiraceae bacterium]
MKLIRQFKKINPRVLITHVIITLGYPVVRAITAERAGLQLFTDAITIIAMVLLIGGILYGLVLRGDFDISSFVMRRGMKRNETINYGKYKEDQTKKREAAFNYPLFLGILYLIIAAIIAYGVL